MTKMIGNKIRSISAILTLSIFVLLFGGLLVVGCESADAHVHTGGGDDKAHVENFIGKKPSCHEVLEMDRYIFGRDQFIFAYTLPVFALISADVENLFLFHVFRQLSLPNTSSIDSLLSSIFKRE